MTDKFRNKYRVASNRWQFWDYSAPAHYFITICIAGRQCILGNVLNKKMRLSEYGRIVENEFQKIPQYHKRVVLDEWVVMPNHIHCIITLGDYDFDNGVSLFDNNNVAKIHEFSLLPSFPLQNPTIEQIKQYRKQRRKMIIPKLVGKFQMQTSKQMNILRNTPGVKNWQSNYHDHVIRNDDSYKRIRHYILINPQKWGEDTFNRQ